jgi:hypothetical protein
VILAYALIDHGSDIGAKPVGINSRRTPSRVGDPGPRHEPVFRGWCGG